MADLTHSYAADAAQPVAGTADAAGALAKLQEIPLPPPVSYLPQTWGWAVLGALLLALAGLLAWRAWRRHQANRYRRDALAELARIEAGIAAAAGDESRRDALAALPALVKRVVLACAPRTQVASLSAQAWLDYLDGTWRAGGFAEGPGRLLPELAYGVRSPPAAEVTALIALLRDWIGQHHAHL
ncbi:transmembrane protein [Cupriavidus basilensis OR16]|uniref:Transmembrane protein n=1 Tax=Cupriavidus basilensis OR16 TaxID=1127483 RepID=H1SH84_9BURK|nr:DUF4381 domain-containing protein [Cupriavidus basilensis]EHP38075.1 transmembrane protein [Cupriavidus basilensis OR16]